MMGIFKLTPNAPAGVKRDYYSGHVVIAASAEEALAEIFTHWDPKSPWMAPFIGKEGAEAWTLEGCTRIGSTLKPAGPAEVVLSSFHAG